MPTHHHDPKGAKALLDQDSSVRVLDVRTPAEWAEGVIKGAVKIDFLEPTFRDEVAKLATDTPWLVTCKSGGRSTGAVQVMAELGFGTLHHLDGGMMGWEAADLPTTK